MTDNNEMKSTAELAAEFMVAYEAVRPFANAFKAKVEYAINFIRDFRHANAWYADGIENYDWVDDLRAAVDPLNIFDGKIYIGESGWDDITLSFDEIDNIETIVKEKFALYEKETKRSHEEEKKKRRARLVRELATLDAED